MTSGIGGPSGSGNHAPAPRLDEAECMAISLICRLVSGNATERDLAEAVAWRDESPENASAFHHISHVWTLIKPAGNRTIRAARPSSGPALRGFLRRLLPAGGLSAALGITVPPGGHAAPPKRGLPQL